MKTKSKIDYWDNFLNNQNYILWKNEKKKVLIKFFIEKIYRFYLYKWLDNFYYYFLYFLLIIIYALLILFILWIIYLIISSIIWEIFTNLDFENIILLIPFSIFFIVFFLMAYIFTKKIFIFWNWIKKGINKWNTSSLRKFIRPWFTMYTDKYGWDIMSDNISYYDILFNSYYIWILILISMLSYFIFINIHSELNILASIIIFFLLTYLSYKFNPYSLIILWIFMILFPFFIILTYIYTFIFRWYKWYSYIKYFPNKNIIDVFYYINFRYAKNKYYLIIEK